MKHDQTTPNHHPSGSEPPRKTRDARGRWMKGHCPNPMGRAKNKRFENCKPSDPRYFFSTLVEVRTAGGPEMMDRKTAFLYKVYEGAMKGKITPLRMMMDII